MFLTAFAAKLYVLPCSVVLFSSDDNLFLRADKFYCCCIMFDSEIFKLLGHTSLRDVL